MPRMIRAQLPDGTYVTRTTARDYLYCIVARGAAEAAIRQSHACNITTAKREVVYFTQEAAKPGVEYRGGAEILTGAAAVERLLERAAKYQRTLDNDAADLAAALEDGATDMEWQTTVASFSASQKNADSLAEKLRGVCREVVVVPVTEMKVAGAWQPIPWGAK